MNGQDPTERRETEDRFGRLLVVLAVLLVALQVAPVVIGGAAAQETTQNNSSNLTATAPYYANQSADANSTGWFAGREDPTLDNITGMAVRSGPALIGSGRTLPGGVGYAGPILIGLVVSGVLLGSVWTSAIGIEGGAVVALTAAYGLVSAGLAPAWTKIVVLILLGITVATALFRATR